jgi:hypothetical protein
MPRADDRLRARREEEPRRSSSADAFARYGPDNRLNVKVSTRNIAWYRDPATILIDQLKQSGELLYCDRRSE